MWVSTTRTAVHSGPYTAGFVSARTRRDWSAVPVITESDTVSIPETSPAITAIGRPRSFSALSKAIAEVVRYQRRNTVSQPRLTARFQAQIVPSARSLICRLLMWSDASQEFPYEPGARSAAVAGPERAARV